MTLRPANWLAASLLALAALPLLAALWLAMAGWNWARGPLQDLVLQKTGRVLHIEGDLSLALGWSGPRVQARAVTFANPPWAVAPQAVTADAVDLTIGVRELLRGRLTFPEVRLTKARVFLEQAPGGRKTWLLDRTQTDEDMRMSIGRLLLDAAEVTYSDVARDTDLHAALSTVEAAATAATAAAGVDAGAGQHSIVFKAAGRYQGQPVSAEGSGGHVLALRDETEPYPLKVRARLGRTDVSAEGTVTSLLAFKAVDLRLALQGDSLATLFPIIGVALPPTPAYRSAGRLLRSGPLWRYEAFTGAIGRSDVEGTLQVDTGGARMMLTGSLASRRLDLADLGPAVGARQTAAITTATAAGGPPRAARVLPDLPFDTARWAAMDADVTLEAKSLLHAKALPLENLTLRLLLKDRLLTLDPLNFGLAGGRLKGQVTLDARQEPMRGHTKMQVRGLMLGRLLPTVDLAKTSIGLLNGDIELAGHGASVGRLLATADGRLSLVAQNGEISRMLMEQIGLHLLEIMQLTLTGDETIRLNCAVADFDVKRGAMQARALVLDTAVNTLVGSGRVDLAQETLDLTVVPRTKISSIVALRSPFHVRGTFAKPVVQIDVGHLAARGAGAVALGLLNPLLALVALFEAGPGVDSECARLVSEAQAASPKARP